MIIIRVLFLFLVNKRNVQVRNFFYKPKTETVLEIWICHSIFSVNKIRLKCISILSNKSEKESNYQESIKSRTIPEVLIFED